MKGKRLEWFGHTLRDERLREVPVRVKIIMEDQRRTNRKIELLATETY
jgi:hypothetical protein